MKKHITLAVLILVLVGFGTLAVHGGLNATHEIQRTNIKLESKTTELKQLELDFKQLNEDLEAESHKKELDSERIKQLEQEKQELEERYRALEVSKAKEKEEQQRLAKASEAISNVISPKAGASGSIDHPCGDNELARAIYQGESSCRLSVINSIGACGLGQSLPCSKLSSVCPNWQNDYQCQNEFFTQYAMQYGSWQNAYNFKFCTGNCYSTRTNTTEYKPVTNPWW